MIQDEIVPLGSPDRHVAAKVSDALDAEIDVVNLKRVHAEIRL